MENFNIDDARNRFEQRQDEIRRHRFSTAFAAEELAKLQMLNDYLEISDPLLEWYDKTPDAHPNKKKLREMIVALTRLHGYCLNLETVTRTAITQMMASNAESKKYQNEADKAKTLNAALKKENEYLAGDNGEV